MYTITVFDKSKKVFKTYKHITKVLYSDALGINEVSGNDILTHRFQLCFDITLYSATGNYNISSSILGALDIEAET